MSNVHIFTADNSQPATRFVDRADAMPIWFRLPKRKLLYAECCKRRRWAGNLRAQVFWDYVRFECAPGHGCKSRQ